MKIQISSYGRVIFLVVLGLWLGVFAWQRLVSAHGDELNPDEATPSESKQLLSSVGVFGADNNELSELNGDSWSGELVSAGDTNVLAAREGQIATWNVAIGDRVRKGQVLGRLVTISNPELANLLAQNTGALVKAEAERRQIVISTSAGRDRLTKLLALMEAANKLNAASITTDSQKTTVTNNGLGTELANTSKARATALAKVASELSQAEVKEKLSRQQAQADVYRLLRQLSSALGIRLDDTTGYLHTTAFEAMFGQADSNGRNQYLQKLGLLSEALKGQSSNLAELEAIDYAKAAHKLLATTIVQGDFSSDKLQDLKTLLSEDESRFISSLQAYKLAQQDIEVKKSEQAQVVTDYDNQLGVLQTKLAISKLDLSTLSLQTNKHLADNSLEIGKQKNELDAKIAELDHELAMANAEAAAAQAAYRVVAGLGANEQITAVSDGIVSAIRKNIGDHVEPGTVIADLSSASAQKIVRFRLAYNLATIKLGDVVEAELLGFPLQRQEMVISGVGTSLDDQGFLMAEAQFKKPVDWPTHSQVKIHFTNKVTKDLIPLAAVWLDEKSLPNVWLIMENNIIRPQAVTIGRTLANQVEIIDGLALGQRYVLSHNPKLKTGQSINQ